MHEITDSLAEEILKYCFWGDYTYDKTSLKKALSRKENEEYSRNYERRFLFSKILFNMPDPYPVIVRIFSEEEIKKYLESIPVKQFTHFHSKRIALWKALFLKDKECEKQFQWHD